MKIISSLFLALLMNCQAAWQIRPDNLATELFELENFYKNHKGVVVIFWQSTCPCVRRYEERVRKLYEKYEPQNLAFVYMSSNSNETFTQSQAEYKKRQMPLRLIRDEGGVIAKKVKAQGTPTAMLINSQGNVVYMGWIDNERREGESGRKAYLEDALKEYLAHLPISIKTSPMFGCPIR